MIKEDEKRKANRLNQARFKANQRKMGRNQVPYWVTNEERLKIDKLLKELRSEDG